MTYNINSKDGFYSDLYTSDDTLTITAPKAIKIGNNTTDTQHTTHIVGGGGVTIETDVNNSNNINLLSKTYIIDLEVGNNITVNKKITTTDLTVTNTIDGKIDWTNVLNRPNRALSATDGGNASKANTIYLPRETVDYNIIPGANTFNIKEINGTSTNNAPTAIWYHVYTGQGSDANYQTQLALGMTGQAVYYRNKTSASWQSWRRLLFADEHRNTTYTLSSPANANTIVLTNSDNNNSGTITLKADAPIVLTGTNSNEISISHSTANGYKHIPSNGSSGQFLAYDSAGTAKWVNNPNTDTKVTGVDNHYTPAKSTTKSASNGTLTDITNSSTGAQVINGIEMDAKGHVTGITSIALKSINTTYSAGTGLSLSGTTFNHSNSITAGTAKGDDNKTLTFGGTFTIPTITYDAQGHITNKGTTTMTMPGNPNTHYNSNTVVTNSTTSKADTTTALTNGNVYLNHIENDTVRNSHKISGAGLTTVTTDANANIIITTNHPTTSGNKHIPSGGSSGQFLGYDSDGTAKWVNNPNTDTKVTSVDNHYNPVENTSSQLSADASSTTGATWNSTSLVTGVDIKRDAKGHVTGIAVDSIKMPANPNTNTTYTLSSPANANTIVLTNSDNNNAGTITLKAGSNVTLTGTTAGEITIASTDTMVTQNNSISNAFHRLLLEPNADNTNRTTTTIKSANFTANPSTGQLIVGSILSGNITSSGTITATTFSGKATSAGTADVANAVAWSNVSGKPSFLTLGDSSTTAYWGDRGKIAYDHSQTAHAPSNAQANQNAFSNVVVDSTTIAADTTTDTLTLVAGNNITLTPDATNDKITITATNTTYGNATTSSAGLMSADDKTKLNGIATGAEVNQNAFSIIGDTNGTAKISANGKSTTLRVVGDGATTVSYDDTNKKLTISSTDNNTTYTALKNPNALYFRANDATSNIDSYDGSVAKYINIKNGGNMTIDCSTNNNVVTYTITGTDNTTYSAGTGLSLSGTTFNHSNSITAGTAKGDNNKTLTFGGTFTIPSITYDAQGHITNTTTTTMTMPGNPNTHYNSNTVVTNSKTSKTDTTTALTNDNVYLNHIENDAVRNSHKISGDGLTTVTTDASANIIITTNHPTTSGNKHIPSGGSSGQFLGYDSDGTAKWVNNPNTDTKVTSVDNHYTPAENTSSQLSADASSTTAATWNSTSLVTGVDIKRDAKGHVTGIAVDSIKMPANPNTNTTYTLSSPANANTIVLTPSSGSANTVTLKAGSNVTLTGTTAGEITIASTDTMVTQNNSTSNASHRLLLEPNADNTNRTTTTIKSANFTANPSTGQLTVGSISSGNITSSGTITATTFSGKATSAGTADVANSLANFENNNNIGKNANNVTYNAITCYSSNGPEESLGGATDGGALFAQAYSTSWVAQIAQNYRNGNLFTRGKNNGEWTAWRRLLFADETIANADYANSAGAVAWNNVSGKPSFLTLGDSHTTAYYGDRGKIAYDHSQTTHAPSNAQPNQNAFSNVTIDSTTIAADSVTDTLTLAAGNNITLTPDATNDKITIAATNTTYGEATTSSAGLMSSGDKTKLNGIASGAEVNQNAFSIIGDTNGTAKISANAKSTTLRVVGGGATTVSYDDTNKKLTISSTDNNTTYTALKNPNALYFRANDATSNTDSYDGSVAKYINIKNGGNMTIGCSTSNNVVTYTITGTDNTTYSAGTGLSLSGTTFNHSNSITAGTAAGSANNTTLAFGGSFTVPYVTYDAQGHITGSGTRTMKMPSNPNTDTSVTAVDNHYTPAENTSSAINASGGTLTDIANSSNGTQVVTGLKRDAKGHVVGVTSVALKATNSTYTIPTVNNKTITLRAGSSSSYTAIDSFTLNQSTDKIIYIPLASTTTQGLIPKTETANNAKFLRNDNTWQTVTPANIGAANTVHNHTSLTNVTSITGDTEEGLEISSDNLNIESGSIILTSTSNSITITGETGIDLNDTTVTGTLTANKIVCKSNNKLGIAYASSASGNYQSGLRIGDITPGNTSYTTLCNDTICANSLNVKGGFTATGTTYITGTSTGVPTSGAYIIYADTSSKLYKSTITNISSLISANVKSTVSLQTDNPITATDNTKARNYFTIPLNNNTNQKILVMWGFIIPSASNAVLGKQGMTITFPTSFRVIPMVYASPYGFGRADAIHELEWDHAELRIYNITTSSFSVAYNRLTDSPDEYLTKVLWYAIGIAPTTL